MHEAEEHRIKEDDPYELETRRLSVAVAQILVANNIDVDFVDEVFARVRILLGVIGRKERRQETTP